MTDEVGLRWVTADDAQKVEAEFVQGGMPVFHLPGGISSQADFFGALRATLPLSPPVLHDWSWDALYDSLWIGLDELEVPRVLIIWPEASRLQADDEVFFHATHILINVARSLSDEELTVGRPTRVLSLLLP